MLNDLIHFLMVFIAVGAVQRLAPAIAILALGAAAMLAVCLPPEDE